MSQYDQHQIPVAYPPFQPAMAMETTANQQGQGQGPPLGYPTKDSASSSTPLPQNFNTQSRGDGFWKGCCAALCCCCLLDACF